MEDWLQHELLRFQMKRASSHAILKNITDARTPRQIMDDLRAEDPEAAMLLGEYIVIEDDE